MGRPGVPVTALAAAVVVSGAAGYGLALAVGAPGVEDPVAPVVAASPVSVVCGASLGALRRLESAAEGRGDTALTGAGLDAEVVVLSQQRLRLDAREAEASDRRALARALDATVVDLARASGRDPGTRVVDTVDVAAAVDRSVSRVLRACPAP